MNLENMSQKDLLREIIHQAAFAQNVECEIPVTFTERLLRPLIEFGDFAVYARFPSQPDIYTSQVAMRLPEDNQ
jgi:hypothetical protein